MRPLHPRDLIQSPPSQLPRLHRGVAVLGEVFPRRYIVVEPDGHLGKARAQRAVSVEPVCNRKGGCVVARLLATGSSLEAEKGKDGKCHDFG